MVAEQAVQSMVSLRLEAETISALSAARPEIVVAAAMGLSKFEQLPETVSTDLLRLCQSSKSTNQSGSNFCRGRFTNPSP